jgi:hypothetical protein
MKKNLCFSVVQFAMLFFFSICLVSSSLHLVFDFFNSRERGRLAKTIVSEQLSAFAHSESALPKTVTTKQNVIGRRLVQRLFYTRDPAATLKWLVAINDVSAIDPDLLARWKFSLSEWADYGVLDERVGAEHFLNVGRLAYGRAFGYEHIGRGTDGVVLLVRSAIHLAHFIDKAPGNDSVPEALFLLGKVTSKLGEFFPAEIKPDRLLNLSVELFPETAWAARAHVLRNGVWRVENI